MIVYITTNLINGRKYIGKDVRNNPSYLGSGKIFRQALLKYGKKNFQKEILGIANNKEELCELESYYIDYYNAQKSELFYNITKGGDGGVTHDQSLKKVKVYQFDKKLNLIREWESAGEASKNLTINRSKIVSACKNNRLSGGYFWSKYSNIILRSDLHQRYKPILQYTLDGILIKRWEYLEQIKKATSFNKANIHKCLKGKYKRVYGFVWKYE